MLRAVPLAFLLVFALGTATEAAEQDAVVLSLLYPVSTNQDPDVSTGFRLSLFYGRVGSVSAVDLNGVASLASGDVSGLHLTGVYSQIGGTFRGLSYAGVLGNVQGDVRGAQLSSVANVVQKDMGGFQGSGWVNVVFGSVEGVQMTGAFDLVDGDMRFLQVAGLANAVGGTVRGFQIAGGLNYAGVSAHGMQLALANLAADLDGAQIGVLNVSGPARGLQLGPVNVAGEHHGVPVGFMSFAANGSVDWVTFASNLTAVNSGIRTTVNRWSSMFTLGGIDLQGDVEEAASVTWNFGRVFPLSERVQLTGDLGFAHIIPEKKDDPLLNDALHFAVQARVLGEMRLSPRVAAFAGVGVSQVFDSYDSGAGSETEPLFLGGVSLF